MAELEDPDVTVLDVGGRWEPEKGNFDHHQFGRDAEPECALSLFARAVGLHEAFRLQSWYGATTVMDAKGPMALARFVGVAQVPPELYSPVEDALLAEFQRRCVLNPADPDDALARVMASIGGHLVTQSRQLLPMIEELERDVKVVMLRGVKAMCFDRLTDPAAVGVFRRTRHPDAFILVTRDDRGPGWTLFRYADHPKVDFTLLPKGACVFQHVNGFIAKTKPMAFEDAIALAAYGVKE